MRRAPETLPQMQLKDPLGTAPTNPSSSKSNIILTGFMGTGKTSVGAAVAKQLGMPFVDMDDEIERQAGMEISEIFSRFGEGHFRRIEKDICRHMATLSGTVIATGGGTPLDPENRAAMCFAGMVVTLCCLPAELGRRLEGDTKRPLLEGTLKSSSLAGLYEQRKTAYDSFPFILDTSNRSVTNTAQRIGDLWRDAGSRSKSLLVNVPGDQDYAVYFAPGALESLGVILENRGIESKIAVVSDSHVAGFYLNTVLRSLRSSGFDAFSVVLPPGETTKSLHYASRLYEKFVEGGLDRRGAVVALGGGVVGDLAGFAAATFMRGIPLVQCPTTVLAMVDSSVGGKTGLDTKDGKNLIGVFKHPVVVCADVDTLQSLDTDEKRCGLAESIKHAFIGDEGLLRAFEDDGCEAALDPENLSRSLEVKRRIVEQDPHERGIRELLNFGHTVGHAIEAHTRYSIRHGEAVSLGMVAAARISHRMGTCDSGVVERLEAVLRQTALPVRHTWDADGIIPFLSADKKAFRCTPRFVLIRSVGEVENGWKVDAAVVRDVLEEMRIDGL